MRFACDALCLAQPMGGAPLDTLEHLRDGDGSSEPGEDVNVIRHSADLHETPLFTSNHLIT